MLRLPVGDRRGPCIVVATWVAEHQKLPVGERRAVYGSELSAAVRLPGRSGLRPP